MEKSKILFLSAYFHFSSGNSIFHFRNPGFITESIPRAKTKRKIFCNKNIPKKCINISISLTLNVLNGKNRRERTAMKYSHELDFIGDEEDWDRKEESHSTLKCIETFGSQQNRTEQKEKPKKT